MTMGAPHEVPRDDSKVEQISYSQHSRPFYMTEARSPHDATLAGVINRIPSYIKVDGTTFLAALRSLGYDVVRSG